MSAAKTRDETVGHNLPALAFMLANIPRFDEFVFDLPAVEVVFGDTNEVRSFIDRLVSEVQDALTNDEGRRNFEFRVEASPHAVTELTKKFGHRYRALGLIQIAAHQTLLHRGYPIKQLHFCFERSTGSLLTRGVVKQLSDVFKVA